MNMQARYDWIAHYKAVQKRIACAPRKAAPIPARERLGREIYSKPIGPVRIVFLESSVNWRARPSVGASSRIIAEVCREFNVTKEDVIGPRRLAVFTAPRMKIYYRLREELQMSFPEIGRRLGGRDHTSTYYGWRKFKRMLERGEVVL
jgi:hypothetical protein